MRKWSPITRNIQEEAVSPSSGMWGSLQVTSVLYFELQSWYPSVETGRRLQIWGYEEHRPLLPRVSRQACSLPCFAGGNLIAASLLYHVTASASLKLPLNTQDDLCPERNANPGFSSLYPVLHPGYCSGTLPLESCPFLLPSFAPNAFQLPLLHPFPPAPQMHSSTQSESLEVSPGLSHPPLSAGPQNLW